MKASVEFLLADYAERCADYRRYVRLFSAHAGVIIGMFAVACGWMLRADPAERPLWALPWVVVIVNVDLPLMAFHFSMRVLLIRYLIDIEKAVDDVARGPCKQDPAHYIDGHVKPTLFFGYHRWKSLCNRRLATRAWITALAFLLIVIFAGLEAVLVYLGVSHPSFDTWGLRWSVPVVVVTLPLVAGGIVLNSIRRLLHHVSQLEGESLPPAWAPADKGSFLQQVMSADFRQRNEDARLLMDHYVSLVSWPPVAFVAIVGVWINNPQRGWVLLLIPPLGLLCAWALLLVYRFAKRLKRYLEKVEWYLEEHMRGDCRGIHISDVGEGPYRIGFFRVVRKLHVQRTDSLDVPLPLKLAYLIGGGTILFFMWFCFTSAVKWIDIQPVWWPLGIRLYLGGVAVLIVGIAVAYLGSTSVGRDPPLRRRMEVQHDLDFCSRLSLLQVLLFGLVLAGAFELFTVWLRFGVGLQSTRDTAVFAQLSLGLRIHHGYIGAIMLLTCSWLGGNPGIRNLMAMLAIGLVVSDVVHHFVVLWAFTGSPEFDLFYPGWWQ